MTGERLGIIGGGTIGCGLAVAAAARHPVVLWARSDTSAERARARIAHLIGKLAAPPAHDISVLTGLTGIEDQTFVIEAVSENTALKCELLGEVGRSAAADTIMATTTSSLSVEELATASGDPARFVAFHVFNPVPRMDLVELAFPALTHEETRRRAHALASSLGKTPIEVPRTGGFVVNRLLFPYLFDAVRLMAESGMEPRDVDACMTLGAGHPMGPLALLDFVGLDVAAAIANSLQLEVPELIGDLIAQGALGRKCGRGLYRYDGMPSSSATGSKRAANSSP